VIDQMRPAQGPREVEGVWTSADGNRALLVARTRATGSDIDAQERAVAAVEDAFRRVSVESQAAATRLLLTGPGVLTVRGRAMILRDVERLAIASTLIVATLLLLVYRSPLALALGLVPVATGEAVDYSIYLFVQAERGEQAGDSAWLAGFWPTIRLGVLTSIAGFSALLFSGLPGLAQLGLYSIAGLAAAAAVTRWVLPTLLPRRFRIHDISPLGERLAAIANAASRLRWLVGAAAIGALVVLAVHRDSLWDPSLASLNPIAKHDRQIDAELRAALGASDARLLVAATAANAEAALEGAERIGQRLDELVAQGKLGGYESPARFLPSAAMQRARLASLPPSAELRVRLKAALSGLPLRAERLEPFLADVDRARSSAPVTREDLGGTALDAALEGLLFQDGAGRWTAIVGLRPQAGSRLDPAALRDAIAASGVPGVALIDMRAELDRLYAGYLDRALLLALVGLLAIVALLFIALRSPARVARVMAPLAAGVLVVAAWHTLGGTRLSLLHLVGLLLVVAIGSNYALFFDRLAQRRDASTPRTLASLALANATTVASFGVLSLSSIPVLEAIGSTVAVGAFLTLIFSFALCPGTPLSPPEHT